ncbi:hypothetical protein BSL78_11532 [Apostichopus japonicus]|uniref:Netrin receptor UNC5 n=1 Tax=Stichopus japonicus TaxID=307972 RepID=A0A2G8KUH1_STIJA|nr:hypothetical protein BSL78_11532 [Apostichopus japonicus]
MAEKTDTPKVIQHLLSDDERRNLKVVDIALVSPTSVTVLLKNDREWCIDTFDSRNDGNEYQRGNRICLNTKQKEPPLFLSYGHIKNKLKHLICTENKLFIIDGESESVERSVSLSAKLSALCVKDNTVYISTNKTNKLMRFKPELPTDTTTIDLKGISNSGSIVDFVVHSNNIYVCTNDGQVSSHKETGGKQHDYRNRKSKNSKARGLAVFTPQGKECNLLLVSWNDNKLIIYSTQTSYDLLDIDLNVPGKIRVTTSCFLLSSETNNVAIYNMKTVADRGAFKMILVSGSKDKDLSFLYDDVIHDTTTVKVLSRNVSIQRKTLLTLVEMYDYSCKTNDNLNAKKEKARAESDELRRMNEEKEETCCSLTKQLEAERKTTEKASIKLKERIKDLEDMRTELESQHKKLKDTLDQEKDKVTGAELSRIQVVTNLEKVEEMNTKLEGEVTELKERLLVEEKTTKEMQTSSLKVVTNLKKVKEMNTKLEGEVTELKERLLVEEKTTKEMQTSSLKADNARKTLEQTKAMLEKEKEYLNKLLAAGERNETEMKKSLAKATTTCEKLQKAYEILQKEKEDLSEQLSTEKCNTEKKIASFSKMTSHALSGSEMTAQRKDEDSCLGDETQSVITKSTDSGRGSMHSGLEYQESLTLNGRQLYTELKVAVTVASKGANMHIPDTGVELDIPTGATRGKVFIEMIILPFDKLDAPVSTFSRNSSVAVELLPNKMEFQRPVRLILPHCLKLTKNYKKTKHQVQVYVSHHLTGPPIWEEDSNAKYVLDETSCVIFLKSFCWVKYEVNNKIVEAKRIRVYTAGNRLKYTGDTLAEIEVGYHWDLPNARENLSVNDNMFVYQSKPFIYVKEGNLPLEIFLTKTVPMQWKYITPKENPKVISFKCVADSKEKSCPFVIEKSEPTDRVPFCMFKVQQGNEDLELYIRFDD